MNILLKKFDTPFETVPFNLIKPDDFLPAINEAIDMAKNRLKNINNVIVINGIYY